MALDPCQIRVDAGGQLLERRSLTGRRDQLLDLGRLLRHRRLEQLDLGREVVVQQRFGYTGRRRHLAHRDFFIGVLGEQSSAGLNQLAAALVNLQPCICGLAHVSNSSAY